MADPAFAVLMKETEEIAKLASNVREVSIVIRTHMLGTIPPTGTITDAKPENVLSGYVGKMSAQHKDIKTFLLIAISNIQDLINEMPKTEKLEP